MPPVDNAASTTAKTDDSAASSAEEQTSGHQFDDGVYESETPEQVQEETQVEAADQTEVETGETGQESDAESDTDVILTENTQKRFDELTRRNRELAARNENLEAMLKPIDGLEEPNRDDFDDEIDYAIAMGEYRAVQRVNQHQQMTSREVQTQRQQATTQEQLTSYQQKVEAIGDRIPDFKEKVANSALEVQQYDDHGNLTLTPVAEAIIALDNGPDVAYRCANDPRLAQELNALPAHLATMRIGAISAELKTVSQFRKKPGDPVPSVNTGSGAAPSDDGFQFIKGATFE